MSVRIASCLASLFLSASAVSCAGPAPEPSASEPTEPIKDASAAVSPGSGVGAQICAVLTQEEIARLVGSDVHDGQVAGPLESACSWDFTSDGVVMVQLMTPDYWDSVENSADSRYQELAGIGTKAFVQPSLYGGWTAAALFADRMVLADVSGPTATPEMAERVLEAAAAELAGPTTS